MSALRILPALLFLASSLALPACEPEPESEPAPPPTYCELLGLPEQLWLEGEEGEHRHDVASDFEIDLLDGSDWRFVDQFTGCDSYVFITDNLSVSSINNDDLWGSDVAGLIERSPPNVHYFFVSDRSNEESALAQAETMQVALDEVLADLEDEDAAWWADHIHVASDNVDSVSGWAEDVLQTIGWRGFGIDRAQTIRGVGSMSDVTRYNTAIASDQWRWEGNLAYYAHEAQHFNFEADRQQELDALDAASTPTEVLLWDGEVLPDGWAEVTVALPSATDMAAFDSLEIDVTQRCPDPDAIEASNCGAWDYLANFYVYDIEEPDKKLELARLITTYHREGRWVVDASAMLPLLSAGGDRTFHWSWAPSWNTQPTGTRIVLRFRNQGKADKASELAYLFGGGGFNSGYNDREAVEVEIPAHATRVELRALITGHGMEASNCAEFCDHKHEFTVNGEAFLEEYPMVNSDEGCVDQIGIGTVPNQWGTWWFGRGGWCPGMDVKPFVVDVTDQVTPGETATISYRGLLNGNTPPDGSGNIELSSWLVTYDER